MNFKDYFMSMIELNKICNEDNASGMKRITSGSVDVILTDPPYLYLKGQKLDRTFDEQTFFCESKRVLKDSGFIVLFGRGTSFYRWNTILADLGFIFKEEIIWDKSYTSSPVNVISRCHETVSIFSKSSDSSLNRVLISYFEIKNNMEGIRQDIQRIISALGNKKSLSDLQYYVDTGIVRFNSKKTLKYKITAAGTVKERDRAVGTLKSITEGMREKSIMMVKRDHYSSIHPTQKPIRLLERLLALVSQPGDLICDPFSGSGSTAIACINTNRKFIGFEIDSEYYTASIKRINYKQNKIKTS